MSGGVSGKVSWRFLGRVWGVVLGVVWEVSWGMFWGCLGGVWGVSRRCPGGVFEVSGEVSRGASGHVSREKCTLHAHGLSAEGVKADVKKHTRLTILPFCVIKSYSFFISFQMFQSFQCLNPSICSCGPSHS